MWIGGDEFWIARAQGTTMGKGFCGETFASPEPTPLDGVLLTSTIAAAASLWELRLRFEAMTKMEMILLGVMMAWTPSLMFLVVALWRAPLIDE